MEEKTIKKSGAKGPDKSKSAKKCENKKSVGGGKQKRKLNINVGSFPQPKLFIHREQPKDLFKGCFSTDLIDYSKLSSQEQKELLIKIDKELRESEKEIEEYFASEQFKKQQAPKSKKTKKLVAEMAKMADDELQKLEEHNI